MIALLTTCLFLQSLCTRWITSAKARAKTVSSHLKPQSVFDVCGLIRDLFSYDFNGNGTRGRTGHMLNISLQEKMRRENTSPCPMIIFFNLFLSSRHAVKNIFSPHARAAYGHRISGKRRNCEDFPRRGIIEWNRNSKFKVLIEFNFSVCFVIQEKLFHFLKKLYAAWTIFLYVDENFSHSFSKSKFCDSSTNVMPTTDAIFS